MRLSRHLVRNVLNSTIGAALSRFALACLAVEILGCLLQNVVGALLEGRRGEAAAPRCLRSQLGRRLLCYGPVSARWLSSERSAVLRSRTASANGTVVRCSPAAS